MRADGVEAGLALAPHAIALDAGSTDSGPAYLATGKTKYSRQSVKRDLAILMAAREKAGIPLLIGSCGTSGCDMAVDWTLDIVLELARAQGGAPKIAVLYAEQDKAVLKAKAAAGAVTPLAPAAPLGDAAIDACLHIVVLLGPEPYVAALDAGADIVLGGQTTDTAVLAAVPLRRGGRLRRGLACGQDRRMRRPLHGQPDQPRGDHERRSRRLLPWRRSRRRTDARRRPSRRTCSTRTQTHSG